MLTPTPAQPRSPSAGAPAPFTGIVVTFNEDRRLAACLRSLRFCNQLVVVDLGSTDRSLEIAQAAGAEIHAHPRVPAVEQVRAFCASKARHDWLVVLDPDEVMPQGIDAALRSAIREDALLAMIHVTYRFYFRGRPLRGTIWGQADAGKASVMHKARVRFPGTVHTPIQPLPGFHQAALRDRGCELAIAHYWVDSYRQMFAKHARYLRLEGRDRYERGERFWWRGALRDARRSLTDNLVKYRGYRCGFSGWFLSFFCAGYVLGTGLSLRAYQRRVLKSAAAAPGAGEPPGAGPKSTRPPAPPRR